MRCPPMDRDREVTDGLDIWLAPFLAVMGRKTRRTWAPLYLRGLLGSGDRRSLQPVVARLGLSGHDQFRMDNLLKAHNEAS